MPPKPKPETTAEEVLEATPPPELVTISLQATDPKVVQRKVVVFYPQKARPLMNDRATLSLDDVVLKPGDNYFEEPTIKQLEKHPDFAKLLAQGVIEVQDEIKIADILTQIISIAHYTPQQIVEIVKNTKNYDVLVTWNLIELRPEIKKIISDRMIEIKAQSNSVPIVK